MTGRGRWGRGAALALRGCLVLLAVVAGGPRRAAAGDDGVAAARRMAIVKLEALASSCDGQRNYGTRDFVFERILRLEPDHARARAALKYARETPSDPWTRKKPYQRPADWNQGLAAQAAGKVAAALAGYRDAVLGSVDEPGVPPARREAALEALVELLPDDEGLHERRGDVRDGARWVLPETLTARKRRAELAEVAAKAKAEMPPLADTVETQPTWRTALFAGQLRLWSTQSAERSYEVLTDCLVARAATRHAIGLPADRLPGVEQIYVVVGLKAAIEVINLSVRDPALRAAKLAEAPQVAAVWLRGAFLDYDLYLDTCRARCARAVSNGEVKDRFTNHEGMFLAECIGQRLVRLSLGVHSPSVIIVKGTELPDASGAPRAAYPKDPKAWLPQAAELLAKDGERLLTTVLTARLNAVGVEHALVGYALAAYLLEGRPDLFERFVDTLERTSDPAKTVAEVLSADVPSLVTRLRRFCLENE